MRTTTPGDLAAIWPRTVVVDVRGHDAVNVAGGITEWYREGHPVSYAPPIPDALPSGQWKSLVEKLAKWRARSTG
ncbi:hypothetical protein ACFVWT_12250 [Arthrobacter sp. NPDC058288]|uniref:hypothetical protein n=1 Tax=Arthrobacter sp. NPDC058288 TaxID=3346424 RepID=UPI0036EB03A2